MKYLMPPIQQAEVLSREIGRPLILRMFDALKDHNGFILHSPDVFALGRVSKFNGRKNFHVNLAVGELTELLCYLPKGTESITFTRPKASMILREIKGKKFKRLKKLTKESVQ